MSIYFDDLETRDPEERENSQFSHLQKSLVNIVKNSKGWKKIIGDVDLSLIKNRETLQNIPVTRKSELTSIQKNDPPFGGLTTKSQNDFPYIFASPGPIYEPADKGDFWGMVRGLHAAGFRSGDLVYNTFSYHLGPAGIMMANSAESIGCCVVAGGIGNTEIQLQTMVDLKPKRYLGTPSFLKILLESAYNKSLDISSLKTALVGAEALPPSLRSDIESKGIEVLQMYGTAEAGCISYETKDTYNKLIPGKIVEESIILEIVRPGTSEVVKKGEVGEIVITKINSSYPMIRFGTGDMTSIIDELSPCGRTGPRIKGWLGRADQSTKVRGLFVTPKQIDDIVKSSNYIYKARLVIKSDNNVDEMVFRCEIKEYFEGIEDQILKTAKNILKLRLTIKIEDKNSLPNDGKVIDDLRSYE